MLSIAIYSDRSVNTTDAIRGIIQDYLIEASLMAKVSVFTDPEIMLTTPNSYDMYIIDLDSGDYVLRLGHKMMEIDSGCHFVYIGSDPINQAPKVAKIQADYFIEKPLDKEEMLKIFRKVKKNIQDDNIIIKTAMGERRLRVNNLNYINIVKRCLCYHLKDGNVFDGQTLRSSFEKAITPLQNHPAFLFLSPSTLINLGAVEHVNGDHLIFENRDVLYFPKTQYNKVRESWLSYTRILDVDAPGERRKDS